MCLIELGFLVVLVKETVYIVTSVDCSALLLLDYLWILLSDFVHCCHIKYSVKSDFYSTHSPEGTPFEDGKKNCCMKWGSNSVLFAMAKEMICLQKVK